MYILFFQDYFLITDNFNQYILNEYPSSFFNNKIYSLNYSCYYDDINSEKGNPIINVAFLRTNLMYQLNIKYIDTNTFS